MTFPKSLREIRGEAFSNCRSLKEIVIPDGVSVMEPEAFSWCEGLERVRLPESLAWLEKRVFLNCSNLKEGMDSVGGEDDRPGSLLGMHPSLPDPAARTDGLGSSFRL